MENMPTDGRRDERGRGISGCLPISTYPETHVMVIRHIMICSCSVSSQPTWFCKPATFCDAVLKFIDDLNLSPTDSKFNTSTVSYPPTVLSESSSLYLYFLSSPVAHLSHTGHHLWHLHSFFTTGSAANLFLCCIILELRCFQDTTEEKHG